MTENIDPEGLMSVYEALEAVTEGRIAVKLSTGEPGSNYLRRLPSQHRNALSGCGRSRIY